MRSTMHIHIHTHIYIICIQDKMLTCLISSRSMGSRENLESAFADGTCVCIRSWDISSFRRPYRQPTKKKVVEFITKEQLSTNQDTFRTPDYKKVSTTIPHSQRGGPSCLGNRGWHVITVTMECAYMFRQALWKLTHFMSNNFYVSKWLEESCTQLATHMREVLGLLYWKQSKIE